MGSFYRRYRYAGKVELNHRLLLLHRTTVKAVLGTAFGTIRDETLRLRMQGRIQIDRFKVENYRSIQKCDVRFAPITFFIGPNASGKTSFVDALLFIGSAIRDSVAKAIGARSAIHLILHKPTTLPATSRFHLSLSSSGGDTCEFLLELLITDGWLVSVAREECRLQTVGGEVHYYVVEGGTVRGSAAVFPAVSADRIFLSNASGLPEFRAIFDFLIGIKSTEPTMPSIHSIAQQLQRMSRKLGSSSEDTGLAARFRRLTKTQPERLEIIHQYLRAIAPPFDRIEVIESNDTLWLRFVEKSHSGVVTPFYVAQSSAGLVNSAETLLELFELPEHNVPSSCVIVEEPEAFLHPGAIQVLRDGLIEASRSRQVIVTTHSPDLLDDPDIPPEYIRTVRRDDHGTQIDFLDDATSSIIRDQLYTAGQLLRHGGLKLTT
jgi:predicted ATPase